MDVKVPVNVIQQKMRLCVAAPPFKLTKFGNLLAVEVVLPRGKIAACQHTNAHLLPGAMPTFCCAGTDGGGGWSPLALYKRHVLTMPAILLEVACPVDYQLGTADLDLARF